MQIMGGYGYSIIQSLVVDIQVDERVKAAMNDINASKRLKEAAAEKAEADKIVQVKAAVGLDGFCGLIDYQSSRTHHELVLLNAGSQC